MARESWAMLRVKGLASSRKGGWAPIQRSQGLAAAVAVAVVAVAVAAHNALAVLSP
jgi:hypothetical protein